MYHEVLPDELDIPSWLVVREARFRRQMRYLKRHFRVLSLDAALDYMATAASQVKARRPPAVITFDDGYAGNFSCALPILQELRLPFTVYVSTAMLAEGGRFWHDRIIAALITAGRGRLSIETSAGTLEYSGSARLDARRWAGIERILTRLKDLAPAEREAIADRLDPDVKIPALRMMTPAELHELSASPLVTTMASSGREARSRSTTASPVMPGRVMSITAAAKCSGPAANRSIASSPRAADVTA